MKKTKILATIGPSSCSKKVMRELILNGANGVRINLSHSTRDEHLKIINTAKELRDELKVPLSIVIDTRGPEVRVGKFVNGSAMLKKGQIFTFTSQNIMGNNEVVSVSEPRIFKSLSVGGKIFACDGLIVMKITEVHSDHIVTKVVTGGKISDRKSLFFPNVEYNFPYLGEADKSDLEWAIKQDVDYFAISFVNTADNVNEIRQLIAKNGGKQEIISKIESKLGIKNIDDIIEASDGIMVARGDLGVELAIEKVPKVQKQLIAKTLQKGKFVITATEMLESMTNNIRPTRAEVSDVANAVIDGSSTIMLSGETSVGKYPQNVVKTMANIATSTEKTIKYHNNFMELDFNTKDIPDIISYNTVGCSFSSNAKAIVVVTNSGRTAKLTARFKPHCPIVALTDVKSVYHKLALVDNIIPVFSKIPYGKLSHIIKLAKDVVGQLHLVNNDEIFIVSSASRTNDIDTDFIKIEKF